MYIAVLIITDIVCAGLVSYVAGKKGYSASSWFFLGLFLYIFALIAVAGLPIQKTKIFMRKCTQCKSDIPFSALICPYCKTKYTIGEIIASIKKLCGGKIPSDMILQASEALIDLSSIETIPSLIRFINHYEVESMIKNHIVSLGKPAVNVLNSIKDGQTNYYRGIIEELIEEIEKVG